MKIIRVLLSGLLLIMSVTFLDAQTRNELSFPDIPGYLTLKCDLHVHTCLSDGYVWPTERVTEAWMEGLDAIAITDHIEYRPHAEYITPDLNASWEIARKEAEQYGLIVIKGAEITRNMPPGHFNALFLNDINGLVKEGFMDAVEAAIRQDAFVFWNHPGWRQGAPDTPYWYPVHKDLLQKGWMHGIEVVNWDWYYPEAFQSALDFGLTMMGNSDIHGPSSLAKAEDPKWHRPVTLVLARSRTSESIHEALKSGRTAIWHKEQLYARYEFAAPLVSSALEIKNPLVVMNGNHKGSLILHNSSDLPLRLKPLKDISFFSLPNEMVVPPRQTIVAALTAKGSTPAGITRLNFTCEVSNVFVSPDSNLQMSLEFEVFSLGDVSVIARGGEFFLSAGGESPVDIRYTTDGTTPALSSNKVSVPLPSGRSTLAIKAWLGGTALETIFSKDLFVHKATASAPVLLHPPEAKYTAGGAGALCDGILGTDDFRSGHWMGFYKDLDARLQWETPVRTDSVMVRFLRDEDSWIFLPKTVIVECSADGIRFTRAKVTRKVTEGKITSWVLKTGKTPVKSIRIIAPSPGACPTGHAGEGQPSWLFIDEVVVF